VVEAAARQRYYRRRITAGAARADVERTWSDVPSTTRRVALALFDDADSTRMGAWRNATASRRRTMKLCTSGVHQGEHVGEDDLRDLTSTLRDILPDIS
jgi:hypothetical protein